MQTKAKRQHKDRKEEYPIDQRPLCLGCRKRMTISGAGGKWPLWACRRCKVNAMVHKGGNGPRTRKPTRGYFNTSVPIETRPLCLTCRNVMSAKAKAKYPHWHCRHCGFTVMWRKIARADITEHRKVSRETRQREQEILAATPFCIWHRCRMYPFGTGWNCLSCDRKEPIKKKYATGQSKRTIEYIDKHYPPADRPCCVKCRAVMVVHGAGGESPVWHCLACKRGCRISKVTTANAGKHLDVGVRPCCITCRREMAVGGVPGHRRWSCSKCGYNVLACGVGYSKRKRLDAIIEQGRPDGYIEGLRLVSELTRELIHNYSGQPFNSYLATLRDNIDFQLNRNPADDLRAVADQVDAGCSEPEEIAEVVPLTIEEIKALCVDLVNTQSEYEWRPIGHKPKRGQARLGIFRKDAGAVVRPIFAAPQRSDMYAVDSRGLKEVVIERRAAQG